MRRFCISVLLFFACSGFTIDRQQAVQLLQEGNKRFVQKHPQEVFSLNAQAQFPFAAILSCADSRVPPELIFDQHIGDLFVVRVAGNIAAPACSDSLIFAVDVLKVPLIIVLGHQNCGAVNAVLSNTAGSFDLPNVLPYIRAGIIKSNGMQGDPLENAIKENVMEQVRFLKKNLIFSRLIREGKVEIRGAYYHLDTGEVELLSEK